MREAVKGGNAVDEGIPRIPGADSPPLYTKKSLCAYLRVSQSTLDRLVSAGKLSSCRVGGQVRFRPADVEEFIAAAGE